MNFLEVKHISKQINGAKVLNDISFTQEQLKKVAIAGETGSGKSTLLKIVGGRGQADAGTVMFNGERVLGTSEKLIPGHPGIAYLSQNFELPKFLSVEQVLSYASTMTEEEAATLYEVCQITHLMKRRTESQLSGGEQQRVALARLLSTKPQLLLLDEPFSNLDLIHKNILKSVIDDLGDKLSITCILVSHDPLDTLSWADEVWVMKDGNIVQHGKPANVYRQPKNEYVAALFGKYNMIPPSLARTLKGTNVPDDKILFIRPDHFKIVPMGTGSVAGMVDTVTFYGTYHEVKLTVGNHSILIHTMKKSLLKGDAINISLEGKDD